MPMTVSEYVKVSSPRDSDVKVKRWYREIRLRHVEIKEVHCT